MVGPPLLASAGRVIAVKGKSPGPIRLHDPSLSMLYPLDIAEIPKEPQSPPVLLAMIELLTKAFPKKQ